MSSCYLSQIAFCSNSSLLLKRIPPDIASMPVVELLTRLDLE